MFDGVIIGFFTLVLIGLLHPVVVKVEYYYGSRVWPLFILLGIVSIVASLMVKVELISSLLGISGFIMMWTARELVEQEERVKKGWFPKKRKY